MVTKKFFLTVVVFLSMQGCAATQLDANSSAPIFGLEPLTVLEVRDILVRSELLLQESFLLYGLFLRAPLGDRAFCFTQQELDRLSDYGFSIPLEPHIHRVIKLLADYKLYLGPRCEVIMQGN